MEFKLPELGENIESGDVTQVLVAVGDPVAEGQSVFEIEAGKATMEIPSPAAGTISALHFSVGDTVTVGQLVLEIEPGAAKPVAEAKTPEPAVEEPAPAVAEEPPEPAVKEPPPAAAEKTPEPAVEELPPVASEEPPEPVDEKPAPAEKAAPVSLVEKSAMIVPESSPPAVGGPAASAVSAAPAVRRLARELGVDVHGVPPTGPAGYITEEDVKKFAREGRHHEPGALAAGALRIEKMSATRRAVMKHMTHCWTTIPHVTQHDVADITRLEELRLRYAPKAEAAGARLTMTAILIKVIASALKVHPKFNCCIDPEKAEILYKDNYNIGIAMDTPKGLLVPVIRDGDQKNFVELALELAALGAKAREGKLSASDLQGGTFTFTNLGIIGGSFFTPIVNSPEVAILGTGRAHWEPGLEDGQKHFRLPLSLSYDHRIIDGADGARFLRWVIEAIEEPLLISLEG